MLFYHTKKLAKALNMSTFSSRNIVYGNYNTYHMTIQIINNGNFPCYCVRIPVTYDDSIISIQEIDNYLNNLYLNNSYISRANYSHHTLVLEVVPITNRPKDFSFIRNILNDLTEFMRYYKLQFCCERCGNPKYSSFFEPVITESKISYRCSNCQNNTCLLEDDDSIIKKRVLKGTLGALLYSLPVFATHTLFQSYGMLEPKIAFVMLLAIYVGYKTFNKYIDKFCYMICLPLCAFQAILSYYLGTILHIRESSNESILSIMARYSFFNIFTIDFICFCLFFVVVEYVIIAIDPGTRFRVKLF